MTAEKISHIQPVTLNERLENGDDICNEDGSIKLFTCHDDFDWSYIAESVDDDDLEEIKNE